MIEKKTDKGEAPRRLRELVLLYGQRDRVLTATEEESILEIAVKEYGLSLNSAKAIIVSSAGTAGVEMESGYRDAARSMLVAFGGARKTIKQADFALVSKYYQSKSKLPMVEVDRRMKFLAEDAGISPASSGVFPSTRWFRSIR